VDRLTLTARVDKEETKYIARVDGIDICGGGESPAVAREELIQAMLSWISTRDSSDSMAGALSEAGYPDIDDDTELELEFADFSGDDSVEQSNLDG
jgi:hypothetical protein